MTELSPAELAAYQARFAASAPPPEYPPLPPRSLTSRSVVPRGVTPTGGLAEVKSYLNITYAIDDAELQRMVDAAIARLEHEVGPLAPRLVTETFARTRRTRQGWIYLSESPVVSIETVAGVAPLPLNIDLASGAVYVWAAYGPVTVTYYAGWAVVPADIQLALLVLVKHLWDTQRGQTSGGARQGLLGGPSDAPSPSGMGYSLPNRVLEMIQPYRHLGSLA